MDCSHCAISPFQECLWINFGIFNTDDKRRWGGFTLLANTMCFDKLWGLAEKSAMRTGNTFHYVGSMMPGVTWSVANSCTNDYGLSGNNPEADEFAGTHVCVCGGTTFCLATQIVAADISIQSCSLIWTCTVAELWRDKTGTGDECRGSTVLSLGKISRIYPSMNEAPYKMSTAKFSTIPNYIRTLKSLILMKKQNYFIKKDRLFCCSTPAWPLLLFDIHQPFSL